MDFDVEGQLGAVERSVSALARDGHPARAVTLSRSYATTLADLWDAATNAVAHPALVPADQRRSRAWRPLSVGGQRGRRDHGLRATLPRRADVGFRRRT